MKKYINLPNSITLLRILGTIVLIFIQPFTLFFYTFYSFCGLTDALDGFTARAAKLESKFGAKLDSAADIFFYTVILFKMLPVFLEYLLPWIWVITILSVVVRACSYITAAVKYKKFASQHTYMNKLSTLMLFFVPYIVPVDFYVFVGYCAATAIVCLLSSAEELAMHLSAKEYNGDRKTLFKHYK